MSTKLKKIHFVGILVILPLLLSNCVPTPTPELPVDEDLAARLLRGEEDAFNLVYEVEISGSKDVSFDIWKLSPDAFTDEEISIKPKDDDLELHEPDGIDRIHPLLSEFVFEQGKTYREPVIVLLEENIIIPRFPSLPPGVTRDSVLGREAVEISEELIADLLDQRSASTRQFLAEAEERGLQLKLLEQHWLINGIVILTDLDPKTLETILGIELITYIQPVFGGEEPPQDANANNDVDDGCARIVSEPYFNLNLTSGYIGLLDSGVRDSHNLFNNPSNVDFLRDCVNGGSNCNDTTAAGYNTGDDWDHGTSSAGILVGNNRLGNAYRGVTAITLDSWKIYRPPPLPPAGNGGLDTNAAVRAYQQAIAVLDRVIVGEIQAGEGENGSIALAADNAYDAGAITVAANGNNGWDAVNNVAISRSVNSPGLAHRAIGVGSLDVVSLAQYIGQSRGPAPDNRYKPDLQAPYMTETSENGSDTDLGTFGGTSGATPYAAGATALMRNWLRSHQTYDIGAVYVHMIQSSSQAWPNYSNTSGLGLLRMPTDGYVWWGKVSVKQGSVINIAINVGNGQSDLRGSLWWPESQTEKHDDIDIHLIDPNGVERAKGYSGVSVFERAQVTGGLSPGKWIIRIKGYNIRSGPQTVFWVVDVRK